MNVEVNIKMTVKELDTLKKVLKVSGHNEIMRLKGLKKHQKQLRDEFPNVVSAMEQEDFIRKMNSLTTDIGKSESHIKSLIENMAKLGTTDFHDLLSYMDFYKMEDLANRIREDIRENTDNY